MKKKTIEDVEVAGQRVLLRADSNVPLDAQGAIADDRRVRATLATIRSVLRREGRLVLMSHLGRPKTPEDRAWLSLRPVAARLQELLGSNVLFVGGVGEEVRDQADRLQDDQVLMLENLRFHPGSRLAIQTWPGRWRPWARSTATTCSGRVIAPTPPWSRSQWRCRGGRRWPAYFWRKRFGS
jgi:phosphoglycerate kinase